MDLLSIGSASAARVAPRTFITPERVPGKNLHNTINRVARERQEASERVKGHSSPEDPWQKPERLKVLNLLSHIASRGLTPCPREQVPLKTIKGLSDPMRTVLAILC